MIDSRAGSSTVEHCPFKAGVLGSNPSRLTTSLPVMPLMPEWISKSATAHGGSNPQEGNFYHELVRACLDRIEEVNPRLNAVVQMSAEQSLEAARDADAALARGDAIGPLHGVPFTLKDAIETRGLICTGGTEGRARYIPSQDAVVVKRLRDAGAILLGKTNCPEWDGRGKRTIWFTAARTIPMT